MALEDFLNNFNNMKGSAVYKIDPMKTFKVYFRYLPVVTDVSHNKTLNLTDDELTMFVQHINLPNFSLASEHAETLVGNFQFHPLALIPDSQIFSMDIITTQAPLIENWLYPWMREITSPTWRYEDFNRPYTIAKVIIDMISHSNIKYVLNGVRPSNLPLIGPTNEIPQNLQRTVQFTFDFMYLLVDDSLIDAPSTQIINFAKSLVQKIGKTVGL